MTFADARPSALPDPVHDAGFYANVPAKRLFAWGVDVALTLGLTLLAIPLTAFTGLFYLPLLWLLVSFLYRWGTLAGGSATWGMRLAAIEIRDRTGARLDGATAFLHTLLYSVAMGTFLIQLLSMVLMLVTDRRQGLHDMILGTAALNRAAAA